MYDKKYIYITVGLFAIFAIWYLFGSREDVSDIRQSTNNIRTELSDAQRENNEARKRADEITNGLQGIKNGIGSLSGSIERAGRKSDSLSNHLDNAQGELRGISEILNQNDGIYKSVREAGQIQD